MSASSTPLNSTPLQLFPSPSSYLPRKSSLKQPKPAGACSALSHVKGVALQVITTITPTSIHANNSPASSSAASSTTPGSQRLPQRRLHAQKRSSASSLSSPSETAGPLVYEDQLCPLPVKTSFTQSSPPRFRTPVARLTRPSIPRNISVRDDALAIVEDDELSPLPSRSTFQHTTPSRQEYPSPASFHSDGSTLLRSNSDATGRSPSSANSGHPTRSMFPRYDHSKPLSQQQYFPRVLESPVRPAHSDSSTAGSLVVRPSLNVEDIAVAPERDYEEVPKASAPDLLTIWHASTTSCPPIGRKVSLDLQQPTGKGVSIVLGANGTALYTLQSNIPKSSGIKDESTETSVCKICPESDLPIPTCQLSIPTAASTASATSAPTTIFPQQAAIDAIQMAVNTPLASTIAMADPTGSSPAAARLAQNAVAQAHRLHTSTIRRSSRQRDACGVVTAQYTLAHSSLGSLAITVSPSGDPNSPRARIDLHHPRATPAALAAQTLALLTLDFASQICVLDTPGLLALDEPYILDIAVSAVLAVAVLENELAAKEMVEFEPPPTFALQGASKADAGEAKKVKRREKKRREKDSGKESGLARETVSLVGMGFKGAVWLFGAGLKAARASAR